MTRLGNLLGDWPTAEAWRNARSGLNPPHPCRRVKRLTKACMQKFLQNSAKTRRVKHANAILLTSRRHHAWCPWRRGAHLLLCVFRILLVFFCMNLHENGCLKKITFFQVCDNIQAYRRYLGSQNRGPQRIRFSCFSVKFAKPSWFSFVKN